MINLLRRASSLLMLILIISCGKNEMITGEVDAAQVDVSVKIPGRISKILIKEGDMIKKGDVLGHLESRELENKLKTVNAAVREAEEQFEFANSSFTRIKNLFETNVIPKQQYDEAKYKFSAAKEKIEATRGQRGEVQVAFDEMFIKAPIDGEVVQIVSRAGEIVSPGYPVITILDIEDQWITFNIREDRLTKLPKGKNLDVKIPALNKNFTFTVHYISALGNFAKWKATNEQGSFDLKTFEVRARPTKKISELRPGMTAIAYLKE